MANNVITGVDFLTNEICNLFGIKTDSTCEIHRKLWYMFYSIQNRPTLEGKVDKSLCFQMSKKFKKRLETVEVIAFISQKILIILKEHIGNEKIYYPDAYNLVLDKLREHKTIEIGNFIKE